MLIKYTTNNLKQTQEIGKELASEILNYKNNNSAIVVGLSGNLGAGKTTFLQGFAKGLGIKEKILSPTFVIQKRFSVKKKNFINFYHIDCYRLKSFKDILELDYKEIIKNPKNIIAIEWPEKMRKLLPKNTILIKFKYTNKKNREISLKM
jgi:tRNA threonylcarbamoyladenosine biosynthesis protein TsaE